MQVFRNQNKLIRDLNMKNYKALPLSVAIAAALAAGNAAAVDFHGYLRAGFGMSTDGGSQVCYGNGGPPGHVVGRLGDECDTYSELTFSQNVYEKDGAAFSVHTLLALGTPGNNNRDSSGNYRGNAWQGVSDGNGDPWTGQRFSFREAYGKYRMASGTEIWAGNRYYGRKDVYMWDLYYVNGSGYGAGIANIQAGPGQISLAMRETKWGTWEIPNADANQPYISTPQLDLRYTGIKLGAAGALDVIVFAGKANYSDAQEEAAKAAGSYSNKTSYNVTLEHSIGVMGGFNKFVVQYSEGGYAWPTYGVNNHMGDAILHNPENAARKAYRIIDHGFIKFSKTFVMNYAALYSQLDQDGASDKGTRYSLAVRPMYMWNDTMSTSLEAGYYSQDDIGAAESQDLSKITIAQAWSPLATGGYWARPQIRVFASFYSGDMAMDKAKTMVGAQVEAWW